MTHSVHGRLASGVALASLMLFILGALAPASSSAEGPQLRSLGLRARVGGERVLGDVQPEAFHAYDAVANVRLPWERYDQLGWGVATSLLASVGTLHGADRTAVVVSFIPVLAAGRRDGGPSFDLGGGVALLSRHQFGGQDYGGPLQFALTVGVGAPLYGRFGVAYRFLHYSDAGIYGRHTTGADFHMIELSYHF